MATSPLQIAIFLMRSFLLSLSGWIPLAWLAILKGERTVFQLATLHACGRQQNAGVRCSEAQIDSSPGANHSTLELSLFFRKREATVNPSH
jgi:hypothetical protein